MTTSVWGSSDGSIATCLECGARYKVTMHRLPCKDSDSFNCVECGKLMNEWNDTEYPTYQIIDKDRE
jgi:hypothetical protein